MEVTIALGLLSYALLALLGLFTVGLSSSRESSMDTALSQIARHVASSYSGTAPAGNLDYTYEGIAVSGTASGLQKYFSVKVESTPSSITNTTANLHLIRILVTSEANPKQTNIIQTSAFVP